MSIASMIIKAVAAYIATTRVTFLRFNSCQNWNGLLDLLGIRFGWIYKFTSTSYQIQAGLI
jgi:hypothetical protein